MAKKYPPAYWEMEDWTKQSDQKSIDRLREILGMEAVENKWTKCKRCPREFITTFKRGKPVERYCTQCNGLIDNYTVYSFGR